jgi:predicted kinase
MSKLKLIFYKGLPASGKSTKSKLHCEKNEDFVMVTKDDIRALLGPNAKENFILSVRDSIIRDALGRGKSVIVADTGLNPIHETTLRAIAKEFNATFEIDDTFLSVPLEECIKRDLKRPNSVGEKVIRGMYNQYLRPPIPVIEYNSDLPDCILMDIDNTVTIMGDRSPFDWSKVDIDLPNKPVIKILNRLSQYDLLDPYGRTNTRMIFFSGRDSVCREKTIEWLNTKSGIQFANDFFLYMRPEGDVRPDYIIKEELYRTHIEGKYNVLGVFDDRISVCRSWNQLGLPLFRVGDPDADF